LRASDDDDLTIAEDRHRLGRVRRVGGAHRRIDRENRRPIGKRRVEIPVYADSREDISEIPLDVNIHPAAVIAPLERW
jgi:hypothetical protein